MLFFTGAVMDRLLDFVLIDQNMTEDKKAAYKYPFVAAEILSSPNAKIFEYFSTPNENGTLANFERLFSCFVDKDKKVLNAEINFTRAGYINKIMTNLINSRSQVFCDYIFKKPLFIDCLIKHSYCKSISMLLLSILALPAADLNSSNISVTDVSPNASNPNTNWLKEVLALRLDIFKKIVDEAISVSDGRDQADSSTNLCNLVINIMSKDHAEKDDFLRTFCNLYLDKIVDHFAENYQSNFNNRLGNIFLVILDVLIRDNDKNKYISPAKFVAYFQKYALLITDPEKLNPKPKRRRTTMSTFSIELTKTNINIYKALEAVYMLLKYLLLTGKEQAIIDSGLEKKLFWYYLYFPFNNVLHNQIQKILVHVVEGTSRKLVNAFFIENASFYEFLDNTMSELKETGPSTKRRKGYLGHAKGLANLLIVYGMKTELPITRKLTRRGVEELHHALPHHREREGEPGAGRRRPDRDRGRQLRVHVQRRGHQEAVHGLPEAGAERLREPRGRGRRAAERRRRGRPEDERPGGEPGRRGQQGGVD